MSEKPADKAPKGPQQTRQEAARETKLEEMREQIEGGTLKIRKMTAADRKRYPAPPPKPNAKPRRKPR